MAENRVTTHDLEIGIQRSSVPGDARVTTHAVEVALLSGVAPGPGRALVTAIAVEVGIWTGTITTALRSRAFLLE
jgi:hypothetical protein